MSGDPILGSIGIFAGNFPPRGWAFCDGQLLAIAQNSALFSILGTTYGGDGRTTFALPDLRSRVPLHSGDHNAGPGLSPYRLGQHGGREENTLSVLNLPAHSHAADLKVADQHGENLAANNAYIGRTAKDIDTTPPTTVEMYVPASTATFNRGFKLNGVEIGNTGSGQSFNNLQPYLAVNFVIATQGTFPSRS